MSKTCTQLDCLWNQRPPDGRGKKYSYGSTFRFVKYKNKGKIKYDDDDEIP